MKLEELLAAAQAAKHAPEPVQIPELDSTVHVRWITATEMLDFVHETKSLDGGDAAARKRTTAAMVARFLCDENGERLVPSIEEASKLLDVLSLSTIKRITDAAENLNGFGKREDLQKN